MDDSEFTTEQGLRDIYYNPSTGYQSVERLYLKAREEGLSVSRRVVGEWLRAQDTYTTHKQIVRKHRFRKTVVWDLADQVQMDLIDMGKYKNKNKGYYWILTVVEILSRYAFAIPVYRKDTKNMTAAVGEFLEEFVDRFGRYPGTAQFDEGSEFHNVGVKSLLKSHGIHYFSTYSVRKAAIVERFNRTLKTSMWKYFYSEKTHDWVGVLDDLVHNYNHTKHSSILMKPSDVGESNKDEVWSTLYGHNLGAYPVPKFAVDDYVRISKYKNAFKKGHEANFTEEKFRITHVSRGDPNMYEIRDEDDEPILGRFYESEMSAITESTRTIEKVIRRKKGTMLVKWSGLSSKHNSWVSG